MKHFKQTYLYIKQHAITGKLYFGKTTKTNIHSYLGSGKYWSRHISKHGKEHVITLWCQLYETPFDLVADALSISKSLDIINNKSWLNMKFEDGLDGGFRGEKTCHPFYGKKHSTETKLKISKSGKSARFGKINPFYGKKHSTETKLKMSANNAGKNNPNYGAKPFENIVPIKCPHCEMASKNRGNMNRYHFDNCKFKC